MQVRGAEHCIAVCTMAPWTPGRAGPLFITLCGHLPHGMTRQKRTGSWASRGDQRQDPSQEYMYYQHARDPSQAILSSTTPGQAVPRQWPPSVAGCADHAPGPDIGRCSDKGLPGPDLAKHRQGRVHHPRGHHPVIPATGEPLHQIATSHKPVSSAPTAHWHLCRSLTYGEIDIMLIACRRTSLTVPRRRPSCT